MQTFLLLRISWRTDTDFVVENVMNEPTTAPSISEIVIPSH